MKFVYLALATVLAVDPETKTFNFEDENVTITSQMAETADTKIGEMRSIWQDYFYYAMDAKNVTIGAQVNECSTTQECSDSGETTQCCVSTVLIHEESGTQDLMYRCMTKTVANANIDMQLGDFSVNMKCVGSGAAMLVAGASLMTMTYLY